MNWYNERYSAYFAAPDADYPLGSAVNSTSEDNLDGTPYLAAFFNDVIGAMQAIIFGAFGKGYTVSGNPDSCGKSDVWEAIKKFVGDSNKTINDSINADIAAINAKIPSAASATNQLADKSFVTSSITTNTADIAAINAKIPSAASATNQLADKSFVNSSIATNTAYFIGTFDSVAALNAYSGTKTNNDYAFVKSTDSAGNTIFSRYKWNGTAWLYEYELNNSSFTAAQWNAINSGATSATIALIKTMVGASASADGSGGFVPQPKKGDQNKVLGADGTWKDVSGYVTLQSAFDAAHPVGSTYTQFPQQDDPATVFNKNGVTSSWQVVDYGGAFFRAQGGNAAVFLDKWNDLIAQDSQNKSHSHIQKGSNSGSLYTEVDWGSAGSVRGTAKNNNLINGDAIQTETSGGTEARPVNYTIRIWKRNA